MSAHPTPDQIALWCIDPQAPQLEEQVRLHLASSCRDCRAVEAEFRRLTDLVAAAVRVEPAVSVLRRAHALVRMRARSAPPWLEAEPVEATAQLPGVRGEPAGPLYLLFRAAEWDLHLRLQAEGRGFRMLGQIHGPRDSDLEGLRVQVVRGQEVEKATLTDDLGEFAMSTRSGSPFRLEVGGALVRFRTPIIPG